MLLKSDTLFSFDDYPTTKGRVEKMLQKLDKNIRVAIINSVRLNWKLSNSKNDELCRQLLGDNIEELSPQVYNRYFDANNSAREAFEKRKINGLNLSDRVWNYTTGFQKEIELGLDAGIRDGLPAAEMTKDLKKYLKHPDMLFRRIRDEHGNLRLSKAASAFHPGQGVYRSSYKNALRLAATETNMAYRTADYIRWQQLDFVVGIRVVMSNNHTCNGLPLYDICDELSAPRNYSKNSKKGLYPKDFKFTGWHPFCRCHVETILKTEEEMAEDNKHIMAGEDTACESVNKVDDVPQEFRGWIADNTERVKYQNSVPYFIVDNGKYVPQSFIDSFGTLHRGKDSSIITDIREAILKIKDPTFITEREVKDVITTFAKSNDSLFIGGLKKIDITGAKDFDAFMANTRMYLKADGSFLKNEGNVLTISKLDNTMYNGEIFNPLHSIKSAINAIRENRALTFNEEYSLESLWHEFRHASAVGWKDVRNKTDDLVVTMESVNQFCARRTYETFVKAIGGKANNKKAIIENGYGYRSSVANLGKIFKMYNISESSAHAYLKDVIINTPYEDIFESVTEFLISRGAKRTTAENLLKGLRLSCKSFDSLIKNAK